MKVYLVKRNVVGYELIEDIFSTKEAAEKSISGLPVRDWSNDKYIYYIEEHEVEGG